MLRQRALKVPHYLANLCSYDEKKPAEIAFDLPGRGIFRDFRFLVTACRLSACRVRLPALAAGAKAVEAALQISAANPSG
jgi:hypothetical protein